MMREDLLLLLAVSSCFIIVFFLSNITLGLASFIGPVITLAVYGFIIQSNSDSRRKSIRAQVLRDQEAFDNEKRPSPKSEDDDWEQISSEISSRAATKKTSKSDYDGFIGFFHPFA